MNSKYTFEYDPVIEARLDSALAEISEEITASPLARYLKYVVLGGGYGRGEGGILKKENGESALYNDLDFFVISNTLLPSRKTQLNEFFKQLSQKWHAKLGIDVDFSLPRSASYIRRREHIMVWREMIASSILVYGNAVEFKQFFRPPFPPMPPSETSKLLMNRMSGLFLAKQRLFGSNLQYSDYDFMARNINKAILACGDAVLLAHERYTFKTADRLENLKHLRLENAEWMDKLREQYERALNFKHHPQIVQDTLFYQAYCKATGILCTETFQQVISFLSECKNEKIFQKLRKLIFSIRLRTKFLSLGQKLSLAKDPYICSIIALVSFLGSSEETPKAQELLYMGIWKSLS